MSDEENRAVVLRVLQALDNADWAEIERHPGLYETRQNYPISKAAVPDSRHTIETQVIQDDMIACVCTVSGTQSGPFFGVPPTGKPVNYIVLTVDRIRDGLIVQHWALPDILSIFQQVGKPLMPAPGASQTAPSA
jgi:predicted ester cyclase